MHEYVRISCTYDFTRGWALGSHSGLLSVAVVDASGMDVLPLLGESASKDEEAVLFFLPLVGDSGSSSSSSSSYSSSPSSSSFSPEDGGSLESLNFVSEVPRG